MLKRPPIWVVSCSRKRGCRMRRTLSWVLIAAGVLLILSPFMKNTYSIYMQRQLLENAMQAPQSLEVIPQEQSLPTTTAGEAAKEPAVQSKSAVKAVMVLSIPKLNLRTAVVKGVTSRDLSMGPGLYPQSNMPGEEGNVSIAGHRNVFGSWFRHLNRLVPGDAIAITYQGTTYNYAVEKVFIVAENDWSVVAPTAYRALTLTTCDPPGNVTQRLIVRARQID